MTAQVFQIADGPHRRSRKANSTRRFLSATEPGTRLDVAGYTFVGATGEWTIDQTMFGISFADGAQVSYWWLYSGVDPVEVSSPEHAIAVLKDRDLLKAADR